MENIENIGIVGDWAGQPESNHPVLKQLKDRIAELETQLLTTKATSADLDASRIQRINELRSAKFDYEAKVSRVLTEAWEDYDHDTIRHIASELDISLTVRKQYEVNLTFTLDIECEIDEIDGIDPEWFDYSVDESSVVDYSHDVVWSKEIS